MLNMNLDTKAHVINLMRNKDNIENEIMQLTQILTLNGVGMREPLVDSEGFPLNNVDVYQVRHARQKIICLQNDHKSIMRQIEEGLGTYFSSGNGSTHVVPEPEIHHYSVPFLKVTTVTEGSPADIAGLRIDDQIVEFGSVNCTNFRCINDIGTVVQHSEGQELHLRIMRDNRVFPALLVPKKWVGKGLLGCNIVTM